LNVQEDAIFSGSVTVQEPQANNQPATKTYVDDSFALAAAASDVTALAGDGLSVSNGKLQVTQPFNDLTVDGTAVFNAGVLVRSPLTSQEAANRAYTDTLLRTAGPGLVLTGSELSVSDSLDHVTNVGVLDGLNVQGPAAFSGNVTVRTPVDDSDACPKSFVDAVSLRCGASFQYATVTEGEVVTLTGSRVNLNPAAPLAAVTLVLPAGEHGRYLTITSSQDIGSVAFQNGTVVAPKLTSLTSEKPAALVYVVGPEAWFAA
jgi:hypothetical protein